MKNIKLFEDFSDNGPLSEEQDTPMVIPAGAILACYYGNSIEFFSDEAGDKPVGQPIKLDSTPIRGQYCGKPTIYQGNILITNDIGKIIVKKDRYEEA
jgi:hypothetical protein